MGLAALLLALSLMSSAATTARSDFASDRAECQSQLLGLAPCLAYVQGSGKAPSPDCCSGVKDVVSKSFKCVCVLIKDRDAPELGLKVNVSRALLLPSYCQTSAKVADCPRLLNLPAGSAEAKVFEQFAKAIAGIGAGGSGGGSSSSRTTASTTGSSSSGGSGGGQRSKIDSSSTSGESGMRWFGASAGSGGVWAALFFIILQVMFK